MVNWVKSFTGTKVNPERDQIETKLAKALTKLDELNEKRASCALAAATGHSTARESFIDLTADAHPLRMEVEMLTMALDELARQKIESLQLREQERQAARVAQREAFLDGWYNEQGAQYRANIERFEQLGEHNQAAIWRSELEKLRSTLEKSISG